MVTVLSVPVMAQEHVGNWGLGIRLGIAENDPKTMKEAYDQAFDYGYSKKELDEGNGVFGIEVLYEWTLNDEFNKLGLKIGIEGYGENELKLDNGWTKVTEETMAYPVTLYYKKDNGVKKWSWFAGMGITAIHSKFEYNVGSASGTETKTKLFPHITGGIEYRFTKLFALGLEARYNIAAKVEKDGDVLSDRSGFGALITGRFYF